jgi:hypothetical protein
LLNRECRQRRHRAAASSALYDVVKANRIAGAALDHMGVAAVEDILSVLDGKPIHDDVVNNEVLY